MATKVLIAHAEGEEDRAEKLAVPIRDAGYDVVHLGTILIGESVLGEASKALTSGAPVVLCGTIKALGTGWAHRLVNAARGYRDYGVRVFALQMEREAFIEQLSLDEAFGLYWQDPTKVVQDLITALNKYYPILSQSSSEISPTQQIEKMPGKALDQEPNSTTPAADWQARISQSIKDISILGVTQSEPRIELLGRLRIPKKLASIAAARRPTLRVNDWHAMLTETPGILHTPLTLKAHVLDYAELEAIRYTPHHRLILTGSAVIVCPQRELVVLHHRSQKSRTFPDHIHTAGGAYQPSTDAQGVHDHYSLLSAVEREVHEELNILLDIDHDPPLLLSEEVSGRFFQCVVLGARVSGRQLDSAQGNWETEGIIQVKYEDLPSLLTSPRKQWVPTGKAHILAWLALGAPGADPLARFGRQRPQELFNDLV